MTVTQEHIKELIKEHPLLHIWGYGYPDRKSAKIGRPYIDVDQARLLEKVDTINRVIDFLDRHCEQTKRITTSSSYHWKHVAEKMMDEYIENGVFIAAALLAGYRKETNPYYNPRFNVRLKKQ
jgi:hypothetical protein